MSDLGLRVSIIGTGQLIAGALLAQSLPFTGAVFVVAGGVSHILALIMPTDRRPS